MSGDVPDVSFSGSIPEAYDRYLGPLLFEWSAEDMAARVAAISPRRVLEVAAGTGILTRHLAAKLGDAEIVATDLNQAMLDHAAKMNGALPKVTYRQADALDLNFDEGGFDAAVCQYGIMFFPDKAKGMAEMTRMLRPGGKLMLNIWEDFATNPAVAVVDRVIKSRFLSDPPRFLEVPFSMSDKDVKALYRMAGLIDVSSSRVTRSQTAEHLDVARGLVTGNPTINELRNRADVDPDDVVRAAAEALEVEFGPSPTKFPFAQIVYSGSKPSRSP